MFNVLRARVPLQIVRHVQMQQEHYHNVNVQMENMIIINLAFFALDNVKHVSILHLTAFLVQILEI